MGPANVVRAFGRTNMVSPRKFVPTRFRGMLGRQAACAAHAMEETLRMYGETIADPNKAFRDHEMLPGILATIPSCCLTTMGVPSEEMFGFKGWEREDCIEMFQKGYDD